MSHHLPLDLLFKTPQDLSLDETQILAEHLRDCEVCHKADESLRALDESLRTAAVMSPAPGFSTRWEERLEAVREHTLQMQIIKTIAGLGGALMLIGGLLLYRLWPLIQSPHLLFMSWVYRLLEIYVYLGALTEFTRTVVNFTPNFLPFVVWLSSIGMLVYFVSFWFMSYRILTVYRGK